MPARVDYLAPRYLISVEGTKLKSDVTAYIDAVRYEEGENVAAKIALDVANPGFALLDSKVFAAGNAIDLWLGYDRRPLKYMNRCFSMKPNPTFPRAGMPKLAVVAHDASRELMDAGEKDKGKTYSKKRDSEIAASIFKEAKITPDVERTRGLKTRVRKKGTPRWKFLRQLARLNGYVVNVRYDVQRKVHVGYFGPATGEDSEYDQFKFSYGTGAADATLLEFTPDTSLPSQDTKLEVSYTDPKSRKTHKVELEVKRKDAEKTRFAGAAATEKLKKTVSNGPSVRLTVFGQSTEVIVGRPFASRADAKRWAAVWWLRRQEEFSFGRGVLLGVNSLRKGQVHELKGLGSQLSGKWQFTSVVHKVSGTSLYEVEFTATKVVLDSAPGSVSKVRGKETTL